VLKAFLHFSQSFLFRGCENNQWKPIPYLGGVLGGALLVLFAALLFVDFLDADGSGRCGGRLFRSLLRGLFVFLLAHGADARVLSARCYTEAGIEMGAEREGTKTFRKKVRVSEQRLHFFFTSIFFSFLLALSFLFSFSLSPSLSPHTRSLACVVVVVVVVVVVIVVVFVQSISPQKIKQNNEEGRG